MTTLFALPSPVGPCPTPANWCCRRQAGASAPFQAFHADLRRHEGSRAEIDAAYRASEPECVTRLAAAAALPDAVVGEARGLAKRLIEGLRSMPTPDWCKA